MSASLHQPPTMIRRVLLFGLAMAALISPLGVPTKSVAEATEPLQATEIFDPAHLVEVSVEMKPADWKTLCAQTRDFMQALGEHTIDKPFTYFPANVTIDGKTIRQVGVRKKGFLGSLDNSRPSLKIKFDEYVEQTPAVGFDRLTLNNNKQDPSRLCQYLSYKLFNAAGTPASRCNFARVTVNGDELGIYSNVECIKAPFLKDRYGDSSGALYEGTITDFFPDSIDRFEVKNKHAQLESVRALADLMDQETFTLEQVAAILDIPAFVKFWATESLIGFWDGYTNNQNNFFLYRDPSTSRLRFIPWGTDSAFTDTFPIAPFKIDTKSVQSQAVLANRLYRHPEIQTAYLTQMNELMDGLWGEELLKEVDRAVELIEPHLLPKNRGFRKRVAEIKSFILKRRATIEKELESGVAKLTHGARRPISFDRIGSAQGTFATSWSEKTPPKPNEHGDVALEVVFGDELMKFSKLGVSAEPNDDKNRRNADGQRPPTVVFRGRRETDEKAWMVKLEIPESGFHPADEPVPVGGIVIEGNPLWFMAKMMLNRNPLGSLTLVSGSATFAEASRAADAPVSGTVDLTFGKFQGGDHLPAR